MEQRCNGEIDETDKEWEERDNYFLDRIDKLLNFKKQKIPVFLNGDPRGYTIKIKDDFVRINNLNIYRDWGGYGIIAPAFEVIK